MKYVYAYVRVSTVKQGERGSSLQEQRAAIEGYAKRHELYITQWFEEKETAAKRGRRVFNHMLRLLGRKKAVGVIIHKIDRSARNLRDWADLGELIDTGVEVHFAHESLDLHSRGGRLSADIQAVVAADYIRNLRDEVRKGFYGRLKQGYLPLPAPLGYRDNGGGREKTLDPVTAPLVRRAFELYATERYSLDMLREELTQLGLRNRHGSAITKGGLAKLLRNEFYIGIITIRRTGEHFPGRHPHLVPKSLFDTVQDVLHGRRKHRSVKHALPYRKTFRCAKCGHFLIGEVQKGIHYYRCHTKGCSPTCLREDDLESQIRIALSRFLVTPEEVPLLEQECAIVERDILANQESLVAGLRLQLCQIDDRAARLTDAYIDRMIDKPTFEQRNAALLKERVSVQDELQKISAGESSEAQRLKKILELVRWLSTATKQVFSEELLDLLKTASSNLMVDGNVAQISWKSPIDRLLGAVSSTRVVRNEPDVELSENEEPLPYEA